MKPESVAAIAAIVAAIVSAANIVVAVWSRRTFESTRWLREHLPELAEELNAAFHAHYFALVKTDWESLDDAQKRDASKPEFRRHSAAISRLEVFASPTTVTAARKVTHELEALRGFFMSPATDDERRGQWPLYWRYAEALHTFTNCARSDMGLKPLEPPPGLARHREHTKTPG